MSHGWRAILGATLLLFPTSANRVATGHTAAHALPGRIHGCTARGRISFMFWGDRGEKAEQDADVRLAEKSCPGLHVVEIWDQGTYDSDLMDAIRSGRSPDVFQLDAEKYLPQFASQGALTNLDPYIRRDHLNLNRIYWPSCVPETGYMGHVWGVPRDCSSQGVLFYNKDMFTARHVPYPTNNWTYRDFRRAAQRLTGDYPLPTDPVSRLRFGYAWNNDDYRVNQYMWDWGGDWLTVDRKRCTLTSKAVRDAFTWWRALRYRYHGAPTAQEVGFAGDSVGGFIAQHYAMIFAGAWALNYMVKPSPYTGATPPTFRWGATLTPTGPASRQALVAAALEVVSRQSRNKNAAWWLARFLTEGKGGALEGAFGIGIPGSVSLARDPRVKREYGSLLKVFAEANRFGRGMRVVPQYTTFWNTVSRDLTPMWENRESVAAATSNACADVRVLLR